MSQIWTIGHSNHKIEDFISFLHNQQISCVIDIRSKPWSRIFKWFCRDDLKRRLHKVGIHYYWLGRSLGGRPDGKEFYDERGFLILERLKEAEWVDASIAKVIRLAERERVALMCAEQSALQCHRGFLIAPLLVARGVTVLHIDGEKIRKHEEMILEEKEREFKGRFIFEKEDIYQILARKYGYRANRRMKTAVEG